MARPAVAERSAGARTGASSSASLLSAACSRKRGRSPAAPKCRPRAPSSRRRPGPAGAGGRHLRQPGRLAARDRVPVTRIRDRLRVGLPPGHVALDLDDHPLVRFGLGHDGRMVRPGEVEQLERLDDVAPRVDRPAHADDHPRHRATSSPEARPTGAVHRRPEVHRGPDRHVLDRPAGAPASRPAAPPGPRRPPGPGGLSSFGGRIEVPTAPRTIFSRSRSSGGP